MIAAGAYIRTLREARHLSRAEVATATGTHESQIVRIENGDQDTRGSLLLAIVRVVRGRADHIQDLILNQTCTADDGKAKAQDWLARIEANALEESRSMTDAELDVAIANLDKIRDSPDLINRVTAYIEGLIEGRAVRHVQRPVLPAVRRRRRGNGHKL